MIAYLRHNQINKEKWDLCIAASPQGQAYAMSWYLDIVSPGWDALIDDDYQAVFPLTKRKKAGFNYLYQPYFTQQLGLFTSQNEIPEKYLKEFLYAIPHSFRLIEIQLNTANLLEGMDGFNIQKRKTHLLSLSSTTAEIRSKYSENLRRNLKKSEKSGVKVTDEFNAAELVSLFLKNRGEEIENIRQSDYDTFLRLMIAANDRGLVSMQVARDVAGALTAGAIFLKSIHSYIFLFSATSSEAKETGAMSRIIDTFIARHTGENSELDFEGSMDDNLARFYKSFGSQEVVYLQIRKNTLPLFIRWLK